MTSGRREKAPTACSQVMGCPMRGKMDSPVSPKVLRHWVETLDLNAGNPRNSSSGAVLTVWADGLGWVSLVKRASTETTKRPLDIPKTIPNTTPATKRNM